MWKSYLKIALRTMIKHPGHSIINLLGLTLGFAICFVIFGWLKNEVSYDRFHSNSEHIYRASWKAQYGDNAWHVALVPVPLAATIENEFPEVEYATQLYPGEKIFKKGNEYINEDHLIYTDQDFFEIFDVIFLEGNLEDCLAQPNSLVVTSAAAKKYFGKKGALGKILLDHDGNEHHITAIVESFPSQSHLQFDFLAPIKFLPHIGNQQTQWGSASCFTYFSMNEDVTLKHFSGKFDQYIQREIMEVDQKDETSDFSTFPIQALHDIHLHAQLEYDVPGNGQGKYLYLFGIIGIIILILACINFINLTTAKSISRAKEIGIRRTLGSMKLQLMQQFFGEAAIFILLSMIGGALICTQLIPVISDLTSVNMPRSPEWSSSHIVALLVIFLLTTLLSGSIPALFLSNIRPVLILKGVRSVKFGGRNLRRALVVSQFVISTALIIGTFVVHNQLKFLQDVKLGFDKDQVLIIERARSLDNKYAAFIEALKNQAFIEEVGAAQTLPGKEFDSTVFVPEQPSNYDQTSLTYSGIQPKLIDVINLELVEGRNFRENSPIDSNNYIINEAAGLALGWDDPIGKELSLGGYRKGTVIGVMKDFHFKSLHTSVEPLVFFKSKSNLDHLVVKLEKGKVETQLHTIQSLWKDFAPTTPFQFSFLDQDIQELYQVESTTGKLFSIFCMIAIMIACLGLLGLSSIMSVQRAKEMGIRKVLGASMFGILQHLNHELILLLGVSFFIAIPISFYFLTSWLNNFAYHTTIGISTVALAIGLTSVLALITVSFHSMRVAWTNPSEVLRDE